MILTIFKIGETFEVDDKSRPGSPPVGRGRTIKEAMGDWLFNNQDKCDVQFVLDNSAKGPYARSRRKDFAKR